MKVKLNLRYKYSYKYLVAGNNTYQSISYLEKKKLTEDQVKRKAIEVGQNSSCKIVFVDILELYDITRIGDFGRIDI